MQRSADVTGATGDPERRLVDPLAQGEGGSFERVAKRVTSFTRRGSRLPERLVAVMETRATEYLLAPARGAGSTTVLPTWRLDVEEAFGRRAPLTVELGSGHGDQIVATAAEFPERDFLAIEVWVPGIARTIEQAAEEGVTNLRVLGADAALVLPTALPPGSVDELWTFFPDPWRKSRHHKRRLVQPSFADAAARVLADGAAWRLATDWEDYAEHIREVLRGSPHFAVGEGEDWDVADSWSPRHPGRILTHFERRGERAGRTIRDLAGIRLPRAVAPDPHLEPPAPLRTAVPRG